MLTLKEIANKLRDWDNILLLSHASPDGDTLGSASAMLRLFKRMSKRATFRCADPISAKFSYLFEGIDLNSEESLAVAEYPDKIIAVDVADIKLLGSLQGEYEGKIDMAIDHHSSHVSFAEIDFVEANAAANAEIIYELFMELGVVIDKPTANCLYTGITTDTGCFKYANTTPRTHIIAARLMELGADAEGINYEQLTVKSKKQMEAEIRSLSGIEYFHEDKIALITIQQQMMEELGLSNEDIDMLSAMPRQIEGVLIGITLKERDGGIFKVSVRTNKGEDSAAICNKLGGGGHVGAAGAEVTAKTTEEAKAVVLKAAEEYLEERGI